MLTQEEATKRAELVQAGLTYQVYLWLSANEKYHGLIRCCFRIQEQQTTFIDFKGERITSITLNEFSLSDSDMKNAHRDGKIYLDSNQLKVGENVLVIVFENVYSRDGKGLHAVNDTDGNFYAYCQTEPYDCCKIFPVFDQPDLKGTLDLYIVAPIEFVVVANESTRIEVLAENFESNSPFEENIKSTFSNDFIGKETRLYAFQRTPLLPSYLFAFALGHFAQASYESSESLPIRLFCRKSLLEYAQKQSADIFVFARKGVAFFVDFFQTKFPFSKLDLLFGPEYSAGAMEYPGLVTFNDRYIFREDPTITQRTRRGLTTLHELAHMWFGDYVTMRWWNDLWLNESFAEFICYLALDSITKELNFEVNDAWTSFAAAKDWAYEEDQLETTHPIAGEVPNTSSAESIFDGITYAKGAAVLKQLFKRIGSEAFSQGLASYFERFKWSNATLKDFLEELTNAATGIDVDEWRESWICQAGLNTVEARWTPEGSEIVLAQGAALADHPTLRTHSLLGVFFSKEGEETDIIPIDLLAQTDTEIKKVPSQYAAFLPNHSDWGYIKVIFDAQSAEFFLQKLSSIKGANQMVALQNLVEGVSDARLHPISLLDALLGTYLESINPIALDAGLAAIAEALDLIPYDIAHAHRERAFLRVLDVLIARRDKNTRKGLKNAAINLGQSPRAAELLCELVLHAEDHELHITGEEAWRVLFKATGWGISAALLDKVRELAVSKKETDYERYYNFGMELFSCADARRADIEKSLFVSDRKISYVEARYVLLGLRHWGQPEEKTTEMLKRFSSEFIAFSRVAGVNAWRDLLDLLDVHRRPADTKERVKALLAAVTPSEKDVQIQLRKILSKVERLERVHKAFFDVAQTESSMCNK